MTTRTARRLALTLALLAGCGPPRIGSDRDSFKAVDALYTAISLRKPELVGQCARTLKDLREREKLPRAAAETLDGIIAEAGREGWESAQQRLGDFMRGQAR